MSPFVVHRTQRYRQAIVVLTARFLPRNANSPQPCGPIAYSSNIRGPWPGLFALPRRNESALSERERLILSLAAEGLTDKEIAQRLEIGVATVRTYWDRMRRKLGTINRAQSVARVLSGEVPSHSGAELLEEGYARILESNLLPVFVARLDGTIIHANDAFLELLGYDRANPSAIRLTLQSISPSGSPGLDERAAQELRLKGTAPPYVKELVRLDGTRIPVLLGASRLDGADGTYVAFVLSLSQTGIQTGEEHRRRLVSSHTCLLR
jgi:PAS domain S-box-containing protein